MALLVLEGAWALILVVCLIKVALWAKVPYLLKFVRKKIKIQFHVKRKEISAVTTVKVCAEQRAFVAQKVCTYLLPTYFLFILFETKNKTT